MRQLVIEDSLRERARVCCRVVNFLRFGVLLFDGSAGNRVAADVTGAGEAEVQLCRLYDAHRGRVVETIRMTQHDFDQPPLTTTTDKLADLFATPELDALRERRERAAIEHEREVNVCVCRALRALLTS